MTIKNLVSTRVHKVVLTALAMAVVTIPVVATPDVWNWSDKSALLSVRQGVALHLVSERAGNWLVSDGSRLYKFDGQTVKDLTADLRSHGLLGVSNIFSDGRYWLISYQPLDRTQPLVWLTDGDNWIEATNHFAYAQGGLDAVGRDGVWYIRSYNKPDPGRPSTWTMSRWYGAQTQPERLELPLGHLNPLASGCVKDPANSVLCTGVNTPFYVNGAWYFLGGLSQLRDTNGAVTQHASTRLWKLHGLEWREQALPNVKFVSGVWTSTDNVLIATSDVTSNPFAADRLWIFNGQAMREVSREALGAGLLSIDAREIKATWNGRAWVILAGKNVVRFDGQRMTRMTPTRDLFAALASNQGGTTVLVGAASTPDSGVPISPLSTKLVLMEEDLSQPAPSAPAVTNLADEIISQAFGPRLTITSNPNDARIGNGKIFVFEAEANPSDEVERLDIYVNGGRVKSCFDLRCSYPQTYYTQGAITRRVSLFARAVNRRGYANDSATVSLIVDANSAATASVVSSPLMPPAVVSEEAIPGSLPWVMDLGTGIATAVWTTPNQAVLKDRPVSFNVAARAAKGLNRIEMWVNGRVQDSCVFDNRVTDIRACRITLNPSDLPDKADVFVNARAIDSRSLETWSAGQNFRRERAIMRAATSEIGPIGPIVPIGPIFQASATLKPAAASIGRGDTATYRVLAQNNTSGLHSIEILVNGKTTRTCSLGAAVGPVPCELALDTANYQSGTTVTFMGRAIDNRGQEIWANGKSVLIRASEQTTDSNEAPAKTASGLSVWSWMTPAQETIAVNETATYTVGAWAPSGIKSIDMIADGVVRKTCSFFGSKGSKECAYTVTTNDFSDEHMVVMNSRVTDLGGAVTWSDIRMVTLKRTWNPLSNSASYAQVTSNRRDGYVSNDQISFTLRGWSPRGIERLELYVNGSQVFTCPSDRCVWTTPMYKQPTLEYQVRMIDQGGQEAWSGLYGLRKK